MMTFKAIAAALTLLLVLVSSLHNRAASAARAATTSVEQRRSFELGIAEPDAVREPAAHTPSASHDSLQNATLFNGVLDAAKQAQSNARSHVPEPKVLLLLGLALLLFGLRRGGKQGRNPPRR